MASHSSPKTQCADRYYQVVTVSRDGDRTTISRHYLFLAAERVRKTIPSEEGVVIRIEMAVETKPIRMAGQA